MIKDNVDLYFTEECAKKFWGYCMAAKSECSGFGIIYEKMGKYVVEEVFLLPQKCDSAYTELPEQDIHDLYTDILTNDVANGVRRANGLKLWIHTHYNFGTFWSGTDETAIKTFCANGWGFSVVINQAGEYKARLDQFKPFKQQHIPVTLKLYNDTKCAECGAEIDRKFYLIQDKLHILTEERKCTKCAGIDDIKDDTLIVVDNSLVTPEIQAEVDEKVLPFVTPRSLTVGNGLSHWSKRIGGFGNYKHDVWDSDSQCFRPNPGIQSFTQLHDDIPMNNNDEHCCSICADALDDELVTWEMEIVGLKEDQLMCMPHLEEVYHIGDPVREIIEELSPEVLNDDNVAIAPGFNTIY